MSILDDPGPSTSSNDTTNQDSWIWCVVPPGKGRMMDKEVEVWFEKCMSPLLFNGTYYLLVGKVTLSSGIALGP